MSGRLGVCAICPKENEQIDAVINISKERRSAIYGTVIDDEREPVSDAVVKLLQICSNGRIVPLTHTFTDQYGQFLLGPLCPNQKYMLKIYKDNIHIRCESINPSCYEGKCIGNKCRRNDCKCND